MMDSLRCTLHAALSASLEEEEIHNFSSTDDNSTMSSSPCTTMGASDMEIEEETHNVIEDDDSSISSASTSRFFGMGESDESL